MKKGDIIKINGRLGFYMNPEMRVLGVRGDEETGLVLLEQVNSKTGGTLSHMNQSWYGIDLIKQKLI